MDVALAIMRAEGFESVTQPRVAREAGVSQGHLTYYFPKKTDLLVAVARRSVEVMAADLAEFYASDGWPGADATMRDRVTAMVTFLIKDRERTRMLMSLMLQSEREPELRAILLDQIRDLRMLQHMGMGNAADELDVDIAMASLWGLALQHFVLAGTRPDEHTDRLVERLLYWDTRKESSK